MRKDDYVGVARGGYAGPPKSALVYVLPGSVYRIVIVNYFLGLVITQFLFMYCMKKRRLSEFGTAHKYNLPGFFVVCLRHHQVLVMFTVV